MSNEADDVTLVSQEFIGDRSSIEKAKRSNKVEVALIGVVGAAYTFLSNKFISDAYTKSFAVYISPFVSTLIALSISLASRFLYHEASWHVLEFKRKRDLRYAKSGLSEARNQLSKIEKDPKSTTAFCASAREVVQQAHLRVLRLSVKGMPAS